MMKKNERDFPGAIIFIGQMGFVSNEKDLTGQVDRVATFKPHISRMVSHEIICSGKGTISLDL